jgi:hypothetical protein
MLNLKTNILDYATQGFQCMEYRHNMQHRCLHEVTSMWHKVNSAFTFSFHHVASTTA